MKEIIISIAAAVVVAVIVIAIIAVSKKPKAAKPVEEKTEPVEVIEGVRYTKSEAVKVDGEQALSYRPKDVVLSVNKSVTVAKGGIVMPGKYEVLSAVEGVERMNVRFGTYVTELRHGQELIVGEGDVICPVSHPIILR